MPSLSQVTIRTPYLAHPFFDRWFGLLVPFFGRAATYHELSSSCPLTCALPERSFFAMANENDADSAYGDSLFSDTTSLNSSVMNYQYENGRRYHSYKAGKYFAPNDEREQERLDLLHHVQSMILGGELHRAPVENPQRILDIGTGTGIWSVPVRQS